MKTTITLFLTLLLSLTALSVFAPDAQASTTASTGTVTGLVVSWSSNHPPLAGVIVELRTGPFDTLVAKTYTNSKGEFTFTNVATSSRKSFHVKAYTGYDKANWYFVLNPGTTVYQKLMLSAS